GHRPWRHQARRSTVQQGLTRRSGFQPNRRRREMRRCTCRRTTAMFTRHQRISIASAIAILSALATLPGCGYSIETGPERNMTAALTIRQTFDAGAGKSTKSGASVTSGETEMKRLDGWATLTGRFVLDGNAPTPAKLNVDKDQAVCGA